MKKSHAMAVVLVLASLTAACSRLSPDEPTSAPTSSQASVPATSQAATASTVEPGPSAASPDPGSAPGDQTVDSIHGTMGATVPSTWEYDVEAVEARAATASVVDVLGVWSVPTALGVHRVSIESDSQGSVRFDAQSYFEAYFANADEALGQEVAAEFFVAADGSDGLWVRATSDGQGASADEAAFFLFTDDHIVVGKVAASQTLDDAVATRLREIGASLVP